MSRANAPTLRAPIRTVFNPGPALPPITLVALPCGCSSYSEPRVFWGDRHPAELEAYCADARVLLDARKAAWAAVMSHTAAFNRARQKKRGRRPALKNDAVYKRLTAELLAADNAFNAHRAGGQ